MHWLIIEDSLENRQGHWFEYLAGFHRQLPKLGDTVTWLISKKASPEIVKYFGALPILPESVFKKMSDQVSSWHRYPRIPIHAWKTFGAVRCFLKKQSLPDVIFVPTVLIHHLLGWFFLIKTVLRKNPARVLLFFPSLPIRRKGAGAELDGSPSARLMRFLLQGLKSEIQTGKVILGVETPAMKSSAETVFALPFTYFPHPVQPIALSHHSAETMTMACYGAARYEKGSDLLVVAIERYLSLYPESKVKFVFQWIDDFSLPDGSVAMIPESLRQNPRVEIISRFFQENEYEERLARTDLLLLPYRVSSYNLRVSRVVIEALVNGIAVVVTRGTTLEEQAQKYGRAMTCEEENIDSLVLAIHQAEQNNVILQVGTKERLKRSQDYFSMENFRSILLS